MNSRKIIPTVLLMLTGCVPNVTTYYYPSMDGGQVLARHCVPTESIIAFGELPIQASVIEGNNGWFVSLRLPSKRPPLSTWQAFHFTSSDFHVRYPDSGVTTERLPVSVLRDDKSDSMVEPYHPPRPRTWLYAIYVKLPGPPPEKFELLIPSLVIDGREIRFLPLRFERKIWMGISPFNC